MTYRLAASLLEFRSECNLRWPTRDKTSDGWIGDVKHATRKSDHNPWIEDERGCGVVRAYDVDAGPGSNREVGLWIAEHARYLGAADFRPLGPGAYVISAGRIASYANRWRWEKYSGANPHHAHTHISVGLDQRSYDCKGTWGIANATAPSAGPVGSASTLLRRGMKGPGVTKLQQVLNRWYRNLEPLVVDGDFGQKTVDRVKHLQVRAGLTADGVVGPKTKAVLHI